MDLLLSVQGRDRSVRVEGDSLQAIFDVLGKEFDPATIKLISKGRRLKPTDRPESVLHKVVVLGTSRKDVLEVLNKKSDPLLRGFASEEAREAQRRGPAEQRQHNEFKFGKFKVCDRFKSSAAPHHYEADRLLRSLAMEVGPMMVTHRFFVGTLVEMDPTDDQLLKKREAAGDGGCLLGYNENAGARIFVRLRVDAGGAFREHDDLIKTLLHELCHNVYGPHSAPFFALFASLRLEYLELRPAQPRIASLGADSRSANEKIRDELRTEAGNGAISGGERASAALISSMIDTTTRRDPAAPTQERVDAAEAQERRRRAAEAAARRGGASVLAVGASKVATVGAFAFEHPYRCGCGCAEAAPQTSCADAAPDDELPDDELPLPLNGEMVDAVAMDVDAAAASRESRVFSAVALLRASPEAVSTLGLMLGNVVKNPGEDKYRRIRLGNARFHAAAGRLPAALELLNAVGFEKSSGSDDPTLFLADADALLLALARAALEECGQSLHV